MEPSSSRERDIKRIREADEMTGEVCSTADMWLGAGIIIGAFAGMVIGCAASVFAKPIHGRAPKYEQDLAIWKGEKK